MRDKTPPSNFIRKVREQKRLTREQLASLVGTSASQITKLERSERKLTLEWMERLAEAMKVPPISLIAPWSTAVIGVTDDQGEILFTSTVIKPTQSTVDLPSGAPASTVAVEVGEIGLPGFAERGSIMLFDWEHADRPQDLIGKVAAVWPRYSPTGSGANRRIFVRRIYPSSVEGRWTLISPTGHIDNDVDVVQAIRTLWLKLP